MATSTIIEIAFAAVAVIAILIALGVVARHKRTGHRRVQAGEIRDAAAEQAHTVGRREALADETAAQARVAAAEADAKSAHARGLAHRAQQRRSGAATARGEVDEQLQRADTLDPDTRESDTDESNADADPAQREDSAAAHGVPPTRRTG
jgi:hypothetical protein